MRSNCPAQPSSSTGTPCLLACLQYDNAVRPCIHTYNTQINQKISFRFSSFHAYVYVKRKIDQKIDLTKWSSIRPSRIVILIRTTAEIRRWHNRIAIRNPASENSIVCIIACRHVLAATNTLRSVDCKVPICEIASCWSTFCSTCRCFCRRGGCGCAAGRI